MTLAHGAAAGINHAVCRENRLVAEFKEYRMDCTNPDNSVLHLMFLGSFHKHHDILLNYFFHKDPYVIFAMIAKSTFGR